MQLVFNVIISSFLGMLVACAILVVIVEWMRLHNDKKRTAEHRSENRTESVRMWENRKDRGEETTRFGIPVINKKDRITSAMKKTLTAQSAALREELEEMLAKEAVKATAVEVIVEQAVEKSDEEVKAEEESDVEVNEEDTLSEHEPVEELIREIDASDGALVEKNTGVAEAFEIEETAVVSKEEDAAQETLQFQQSIQKYREITKMLVIHEGAFVSPLTRVIPDMEKVIFDLASYEEGNPLPKREVARMIYYLEIVEAKLTV